MVDAQYIGEDRAHNLSSCERSQDLVTLAVSRQMQQTMDSEKQPEWLDLKALQRYACVSERTIRGWIHDGVNPLPAVRVGRKMLVRRSVFDCWLEGHAVKHVDVDSIVSEIMIGVMR
jgi:excisionase family DNA binding protein